MNLQNGKAGLRSALFVAAATVIVASTVFAQQPGQRRQGGFPGGGPGGFPGGDQGPGGQ